MSFSTNLGKRAGGGGKGRLNKDDKGGKTKHYAAGRCFSLQMFAGAS